MCECDPRCQAFLAKAWPGVPVWGDVRTFRLADTESRQHSEHTNRGRQPSQGRPELVSSYKGRIWLLTAGVPCQPASRAGKQRGAADDRWLWPHAINVFSSIRPAWALFENPPGIGDVGLAGILSQLEGEGYAVRVFSVGACALGAPHRRMRYWIVCKSMDNSETSGWRREQDCQESRPSAQDRRCTSNWSNAVWLPCADGKVRRAPDDSQRMAHGLPVELLETLAEEINEQIAKGGDHFTPHRTLLGALGNSIVPQVAQVIIKAMIQSE